MTTSFSQETISSFSKALASKDPVPGGGGASALVGSLGVCLGNMVGSLTVGKKRYALVETELRALMEEGESLRKKLLTLMDEDAAAFIPLSKAYSLPSTTQEEKDKKTAVMAKALKDACKAPLEIMECCARALELTQEFTTKGSVIAVSDAGVSAALCVAALKGASLNIFINTKSMTDQSLARNINERAKALLEKYVPMGENIFSTVLTRLTPKEEKL